MDNSINSISSMSSNASFSLSSSSQRLTDATKKELEALGLDTASIKTEAQGQALLKTAKDQMAQKAQPSGTEQVSESKMRSEIMALASQLGVSASKLDDIDSILKSIKTKLEKMKAESVSDVDKTANVSAYQAQYDSLEKENESVSKSQSMLSSSMNNMAMMNKILLKL